ncbi:MAG TPA: mannosyl-3-phosphoglycerate synthase [Candidatus Krumholzibacteria bacterium]|nr:mannosyl-3-phosphoglycerate synthase [Candidatus Krumholzibacteria bacterium]
MRIELPKGFERIGAVRLGDLQKVFELDAGMGDDTPAEASRTIRTVPYRELHRIQRDMAIVIPVKGERLKLIEGVLCGVPHACLTIVVSNSARSFVDRFGIEKDAVHDFCNFVGKRVLIAHQKDPALAGAFAETGYRKILTPGGAVRDGKAEGMLIGTMLACLAGKKYVGFIDSDNYFPGAVEEYVREYAAGFAISRTRHAMVRIAWHSKPKIVESKLFFRKWGRSTVNTNRLLNRLIGHYTGFETEIVKTGNAGEHALTMDLAMSLDYSAGYSIEPYHIVNLLERYGGIVPQPGVETAPPAEVFQIESRNPHLHEAGDESHIDRMQLQAMQTVYHSPLCPEPIKREIAVDAARRGLIANSRAPFPRLRYFPALSTIDRERFLAAIADTEYGRYLTGANSARHTLRIG